MERSDAELRELIATIVPPVPKVPPAYVEAECVIVEPIKDVIHEYAVALTIADLIPDARAWADHRSEITPHFFAVQFLMLCVENPNLGKQQINVDKESSPGLYNKVLMAFARQQAHLTKKNDPELIKRYVVGGHYVSLAFLRELKGAIEKVKAEAAKKKKKKKDGEEEEEEEEDEEEEIPIPPPIPIPVVPQFHSNENVLNVLHNVLFINREPKPGAVSDNSSRILLDHQLIFDSHPWIRRNERIAVAAVAATQDDDDIFISPNAQDLTSKATFTVMPCYDCSKKNVGYLIRVFQHDGSWNPGVMIQELDEQIRARNLNAGNLYYKDPWPQYRTLLGTSHPVHKMTMARWFQLVNRLKPGGGMLDAETMMRQEASGPSVTNYKKDFHPSQVFTLSTALSRLRGVQGIVGDEAQYQNGAFPENQRAYRYLSSQVHWANTKDIGLSCQYFPGITEHGISPETVRLLETNPNVTLDTVSDLFPRFGGQKTSNVIIRMEEEADASFKRCDSIDFTDDKQYDAYCVELRRAQKENTQKLTSICQLEGAVDNIPISPPMRATLVELQKHQRTITCDLPIMDKDMSFFGNYIARMELSYEKTLRIIHTRYSVMCHGLFSCTQRRDKQLLFSLIIFGPGALGKSASTTGFIMKCAIPGTWTKIDRLTAAADQTDKGVYDEIRVCEEFDDDYVSATSSTKNKEKVNIKKSSMTSGSISVKTFDGVTVPGIGKVRDSRLINIPMNVTEVANTNASNIAGDALASRYHRENIHETDVPANELNYSVLPEASKRVVDEFRIMQGLSYWVEKSMGIFAICRNPNMRLWDDVSDRMLQFLHLRGVLSATDMETNRGRIKDLMTPVARQFTIENAINCCWNVKGGPCYGKPFHPSQFADVAPYLYCTLDIILFTWTLLSSIVINEDFGDVLGALYQMATGDPIGNKSNYELYQKSKRAKFKTMANPSHNRKQDGNTNATLMDLNYLEVVGTIDKVASNVAPLTRGKIPAHSVSGLIQRMSNIDFTPRHGHNDRNGYEANIGTDDMLHHKPEEVSKCWLSGNDYTAPLRDFINEYKSLYAKDVAVKMNSKLGDSYANAKAFFAASKLSDEDIVLLYVMRNDWKSETFEQDLIALKQRDMKQWMQQERLERILRAFLRPVRAENPYLEAINFRMTYPHAEILYHMLECEYLAEEGKPKSRQKVKLITDSREINFPRLQCEDEIPQLYGNSVDVHQAYQLRIVDLSSKKHVYFAPSAAILFNKQMILDAFNAAVICESTPETKYILGWPHPENPSKAQTMTHSKQFIKSYIIEQAKQNPNAQNRANGVVFHRRGYVSGATEKMLGKVTRDKANYELLDRLNYHSAYRQHRICGKADTVRDPDYILSEYVKAGGVLGTVNYPTQLIDEELAEQKANWFVNDFCSNKRRK